jgi:glutamate formiminotransferase / formiminotetrahydrofolate cyclodeaminase
MAQISFNLLDTDVTAVHEAFEAVKEEAEKLNVAIVGSEIVGLIPLADILKAADYYMERENLFITDEAQRVRLVIERLGLQSCAEFKPEERIIDYVAKDSSAEELASMSVRDFIEILGARTAAPGGGSAAALAASMGAGLGAMMGWMTFGSKKWEDLDSTMRKLIGPMHQAMMDLIPMIDADTDAFTEFVNASRMPKDTPEEVHARDIAMEEGLKTAIRVPLKVMEIGDSCWGNMEELAKHGNMSSVSDLEVGARSLELGIWGAYRNVVVNMKDIKDGHWEKETMQYADEMVERAKVRSENVLKILNGRS